MTAAAAPGELVLYHGSQTRHHGEWYLTGPCACGRCTARVLKGGGARWELADVRGRQRITCVRRESFTPCSKIPQEPAPAGHKTRTSQPSGYQADACGARTFDKRGRVVRDRSSFAMCTCGWVSAGATRGEARGLARRHREEQEALGQAAGRAAIAALRAKLEGPAAPAAPVPEPRTKGNPDHAQ